MSYQRVLDALGDGTRRRIVERLRRGPLPVGRIASGLPVSRPAVSRHLRVLRASGLVTYEEDGTRNLYRLRPRALEEVQEWLDRFWDEPLRRFAEHVERREDRREGRSP